MSVQPDPMFKPTKAALPYRDSDGNSTGGHVNVDTSRERAQREAANGTAERRQRGILQLLENAGTVGMTWKEISNSTGEHHGQVSGALSGMHKEGAIAALKHVRRNGCGVYVLPKYVLSRIVRDFRPNTAPPEPVAPPAPRPHLNDEEKALIAQIDAGLPNFNDKPSVPIKPASMKVLIAALKRLDAR